MKLIGRADITENSIVEMTGQESMALWRLYRALNERPFEDTAIALHGGPDPMTGVFDFISDLANAIEKSKAANPDLKVTGHKVLVTRLIQIQIGRGDSGDIVPD